jgi:hypothetical protein
MSRRYAEGTTVSVQKSKDELRALLKRYGATKLIDVTDDELGDAVQFEMRGRWLRFSVPKPDPEKYREYKRSPRDWYTYKRTDDEVQKKAQQEYMRRWRVLVLLVKGKLEAAMSEDGDDDAVDFETEFMGYMLLPDGSTVGEGAKPQLDAMYSGRPLNVRALLGMRDEE